jgi:hypothetical protein
LVASVSRRVGEEPASTILPLWVARIVRRFMALLKVADRPLLVGDGDGLPAVSWFGLLPLAPLMAGRDTDLDILFSPGPFPPPPSSPSSMGLKKFSPPPPFACLCSSICFSISSSGLISSARPPVVSMRPPPSPVFFIVLPSWT